MELAEFAFAFAAGFVAAWYLAAWLGDPGDERERAVDAMRGGR